MATSTLFKTISSSLGSQSCSKIFKQSFASFHNSSADVKFGLLFDIDGVLLRGKKPIPAAVNGFQRLVDRNGEFRVPVTFVTNAGNALRKCKADQLTEALGVKISENQVMLSHSPMRMFQLFHNKRVLLSGQGPVEEIASNLGFTNTVTIDEVREYFPMLDMVDHTRRPKTFKYPSIDDFPPIEAVVLFGEPVRWETNLQIISDILLTDGTLRGPMTLPDPQKSHVPVIACNMDLQWMSETHMPRFGHGMFLQCLESVYLKLTGKSLQYSALIGKPSECTYYYAEQLVTQEAGRIGAGPLRTLYAIGDNPMADIYGANLYNRRLHENNEQVRTLSAEQQAAVANLHTQQPWRILHAGMRNLTTSAALKDSKSTKPMVSFVEACYSVLVRTGVYSEEGTTYDIPPVFHGPRDMEFDRNLCEPSYITEDVDTALDIIFELEEFQ